MTRPPDSTLSPTAPRHAWIGSFALRVWTMYVALSFGPDLLALLPAGRAVASWIDEQTWHRIVPWAGQNLLRLGHPITIFPNGSGDTTYNYVQLACFGLLACLIGAAWTIVRRPHDQSVREAQRILLRYAIAASMLSYGFAKVFLLQFAPLNPDRLMVPYGDSSPMGLLWRFMAYSPGYCVFTGTAEVIGGALLIVRSTTTLGSLIVAGVMTNVVALNLCFDVPVKIYSTHLLVGALWLLTHDAARLWNVLVMNRAAPPARIAAPWRNALVRRVAFVGKCSVLALLAHLVWLDFREMWDPEHAERPPELSGLFDVEPPERDTHEEPPPYKRMFIDEYGIVTFRRHDERADRYIAEFDVHEQLMTLVPFTRDREETLHFETQGPLLTLSGTLNERPIRMVLRARTNLPFPLLQRGFHWINEGPLND